MEDFEWIDLTSGPKADKRDEFEAEEKLASLVAPAAATALDAALDTAIGICQSTIIKEVVQNHKAYSWNLCILS